MINPQDVGFEARAGQPVLVDVHHVHRLPEDIFQPWFRSLENGTCDEWEAVQKTGSR